MRFSIDIPDQIIQGSSAAQTSAPTSAAGGMDGAMSGGAAPGSDGPVGGVAFDLAANAYSAGAAEQYSGQAASGNGTFGNPVNDGGAAPR
jgi:hypothetical protein